MRLTQHLFIFLLIFSITIQAWAAEKKELIDEEIKAISQEIKAVDLERIIVTSRRTPIDLTEISENVTSVAVDDIEYLPAQDLGEALKYIPGVNIDPRQGFGRATSISIQGAYSRQVKVMIDGIPLNTQVSEEVDPSRFPIKNISRIEVIKGAASSIWGSSLGGVINIITKDTGDSLVPKGSFTTSFAEFRTKREEFDLSGKIDNLGYYFLSSYMESGGQGPKDDVLEKKVFAKLSYDLGDNGKIVSTFGYSGADVNSGLFPDGTFWAQPYRIRYGKIGWQLDSGNTDLNFELKHSRQDIVSKIHASLSDDVPFEIISKDVLYQLSLHSATNLGEEDLLILGLDLDWETIKSNIYLSKAKTVKLRAPYVNYSLKLEPWDFNFGLRYDYNSEFGEELSPSLGIVYCLDEASNSLIRFDFSRAFNAPLLLWKYNQNVNFGTIPNPNIGAERGWVYELGLESQPLPKLWLKLALYRADISDALAVAENELGEQFMKNFERFRRQGVELQFKIDISDELSFSASGAFNDIENRATKQTVRGAASPRHSFDLALQYKNKHGLGISFFSYYDRWNEPASSQARDRKMLTDLKISQKFKKYTLFLNIHNLTNSKYWRDYFFPLPGRYFEGGFSFKW